MAPTVYLGLWTDQNSEPVIQPNQGYERQTVVFSTTVPGRASNAAEVKFPIATYDWGAITHFYVWDAPKGGAVLLTGQLENGPLRLRMTSQAIFPVGGISVRLDPKEKGPICKACAVIGQEWCENHRPPPAKTRSAWQRLMDEDE